MNIEGSTQVKHFNSEMSPIILKYKNLFLC